MDAGFITEVAEIGTQRTQRRAEASGEEEGSFGCGVRKARAFATLGAQDRQNDRFVDWGQDGGGGAVEILHPHGSRVQDDSFVVGNKECTSTRARMLLGAAARTLDRRKLSRLDFGHRPR